jgi:hypothetical protein
VLDGPAIADGVVYWGSGYAHIKPGKPNNMVFALAHALVRGTDLK